VCLVGFINGENGRVICLLKKQEGIAVGRTFAALGNYKVDGNKEMMAIGCMNVVGSFTSCYVTTGSCLSHKFKRLLIV